ncbi:uncharacterized protein LOC143820868 isoform X2 [Paroedura picta]|uniref:uncharacterized protein LOC143820868 isoform X2 n=1 Tax=Paroedura picta TaxID=143630 RepID=UPI0040579891
MNAAPASEGGPYSTTQKPFFYAQPTAQQMFPNPCFLGPVYNPYGIPATGVLYGPSDRGELVPSITYPDEQKDLGDEQEKEPQLKGKLDAEKQGTTSHWTRSPLDEAKAAPMAEPMGPDLIEVRQENGMSKGSSGSKRSSGSKPYQEGSDLIQQSESPLSGREKTNDSDFPGKREENNEVSLEKSLWCDESVKYIPSDSWLARMDNLDPNYNTYLSQRKRPSVLSHSSDEMSSVDEGSSMDNIPMSYFVPGYTFQKSGYPFKKIIEGSEKERIRSGGFLNEDKDSEDKEGGEQVGTSEGQNVKRIKMKELSSRSRKLGTLPRSSSRKKLYSFKKKAAKSLSPSEADDSEEYWVKEPDEEEEEEEEKEEEEEYYLIQGVAPYGTLAPAKYGLYRQDGQQVLWKVPKNAVPAQLISWPVQEKKKNSRPANKLKDQEEDEDLCDDYNFYLKKSTAQQLEVLEHRRNSQRYSGKLLKEGGGVLADDYWLKSGAKPKFASLLHSGLSPTAKSRESECTPKKKGVHKPPHKRRDTRDDVEIEEQWEKMKTARHHTVHGMKRSLYKGRSEL